MNQTKGPLNYAYSPFNCITGMRPFFSFGLVEYTNKLLKVLSMGNIEQWSFKTIEPLTSIFFFSN